MFRAWMYLNLALILVLSLNETGGQRFGPRDAGYITRYRKKSSFPDDHPEYTEGEEIYRRWASDSSHMTRETPIDSNSAKNHEAYSKRANNDNVDASLRFLQRAGRSMQNQHSPLLPNEDEVVDLESLPGKELKLTRFACNYSKQNSHPASKGGNLPAKEEVTETGTERPFQEGHIGKDMEVLEKKWASKALSRNAIPIRREDAVNYRLVTVYPKSRLTMENLINYGLVAVVVLFLIINISRIGRELFRRYGRSSPSQHQTRTQEPPTRKTTPPSEETEPQKLTRSCGNCLTLKEVINELLAYLASSKIIISNLENQIQNRLRRIPLMSSTQRNGESKPPQKTREKLESTEENGVDRDWERFILPL